MGFLDFGYAYARNDIVYDWFYNVISTGVRVLTERSGEIPHGRNIPSV